ncbi:hypothetical protein [Paraburkholderia caballeronis]|uniref:hypothetical protein n=1 Tax=Paraburkholderia caballeronis TaxID=416943 RepID=UPI0010660DC1|nr:hypothetical protein [Paraburkholderia caballeronis]
MIALARSIAARICGVISTSSTLPLVAAVFDGLNRIAVGPIRASTSVRTLIARCHTRYDMSTMHWNIGPDSVGRPSFPISAASRIALIAS